jgi:phosphatidate cytidylyltransferase
VRGAREITAFVLVPIALVVIVVLPPWVYLAAVFLLCVLAAWELLALLRLRHPVPVVPTLVVLGLALVGSWLVGLERAGWILAAVVLVVPLVYLLGRYPIGGAAAGVAGATFAAAYFVVAGGGMGHLRLAFAGDFAWKVVLTHCLIIWAGDSGAYYLGSRFGRHRLAPLVSPKKSWEGVVGGVAGSFLAVWVCRVVFFPELGAVTGLALAALLSVLAPLGDLVESLFKRDVGIKDSSAMLPGHGGFLDRTDSLFFAAPFVLALLKALEPLGR